MLCHILSYAVTVVVYFQTVKGPEYVSTLILPLQFQFLFQTSEAVKVSN